MRIIRIKNCRECPYFREGEDEVYTVPYYYCDKSNDRKILKDEMVPDWCPLKEIAKGKIMLIPAVARVLVEYERIYGRKQVREMFDFLLNSIMRYLKENKNG